MFRNVHDFGLYPKLPKLKARKERKIILVLSLRKAALPNALLGCDAHETNNKKKVGGLIFQLL